MEDLQAQDTMTTQVLMMVPDAHKEEEKEVQKKEAENPKVNVEWTLQPTDVQEVILTIKDGAWWATEAKAQKEQEKALIPTEDAHQYMEQDNS